MRKNKLAQSITQSLLGSVMTVSVILPNVVSSQDENHLTAKQIIQQVDEVAFSQSSQGRFSQTITTTSGAKRTLEMIGYSKDGTDKQLTVYTQPARVKGEAMLMLNDGNDIWYYSPRTDRVRKIASNAKKRKVMGSDFSYEDMATGTMAEKYTAELIKEEKEQGVPCYVLKMIPTDKGPSYSKIMVWVDQQKFIPVRIDYWDQGEKPFKRMVINEIKKIDGHMTPMNYMMTNLKEGSVTRMEIKEMTYDVQLKDSLFTVRNLKRR